MRRMLWHRLLLLTLLGLGGRTAICAQAGPSFDCRKAANATEKQICKDPNLARLDRDLASLWRGMIRSFTDSGQIAVIKSDQKAWIAGRNECGEDAGCIAGHYREEIERFQGRDTAYPAAGVFAVEKVGEAALYPHDGGYLVSIQTADPKDGSWTCTVSGTAKAEGDGLRVTAGDASFTAISKAPGVLEIAPGREVHAVAKNDCGLNGSIAFTFKREGSKGKR